MSDYDLDANEPAAGRPTIVRHFVVLSTMLMALLLYLDRFCVSFAADFIREDLDLTQTQIADFLGAFFWSYALAQVPSGWLSDRYGARIMLVIYILSWSLFTALIGAATSFVLLLAARVACGLGQSGAYPTSASVVSKWVPFSNRGTASSLIAFGGRLGGAIAPLLTASLILAFVPLDTPTDLQPKELLHGPRLAARLAPLESGRSYAEKITQPAAASRHVWSLLPEVSRPAFVAAADRYRDRESQVLSLQANLEAIKDQPANAKEAAAAENAVEKAATELDELQLTDENRRQVLAAINSLLTNPELYNEQAFADVQLGGALIAYLKRIDKGDSLADLELRRFNRFLLEAIYRDEIGKLYVQGWRPVMFVYGAAGLLVSGLFWLSFRNRPEVHPWANDAERRLIASGRPAGTPSPHGKAGTVPIVPLLKSVSMWADCFMQVGTNVGWVFLVTWLPRYLYEVHHVPLLERGVMSMIPLIVGFCGMLIGGRLTDALTVRVGVKWGRRGPMMFTRFTAACAYGLCLFFAHSDSSSIFNSPWAFVVAFSLVAMSTDMGTAAGWAFKQDVAGRYVGSVLGWGNMWGNLGAACSPRIYDYFLGENPTIDDWNQMFLVCMSAFIFAGMCGWLIDATKNIAPPEEEEDENDNDEETFA